MNVVYDHPKKPVVARIPYDAAICSPGAVLPGVDGVMLPGRGATVPVSGSRYLGRGVAEPDDDEDVFESKVVFPFAP
jgi:hypothetical protein